MAKIVLKLGQISSPKFVGAFSRLCGLAGLEAKDAYGLMRTIPIVNGEIKSYREALDGLFRKHGARLNTIALREEISRLASETSNFKLQTSSEMVAVAPLEDPTSLEALEEMGNALERRRAEKAHEEQLANLANLRGELAAIVAAGREQWVLEKFRAEDGARPHPSPLPQEREPNPAYAEFEREKSELDAVPVELWLNHKVRLPEGATGLSAYDLEELQEVVEGELGS